MTEKAEALSCLEAALSYARRGWRVLPVHSVRRGRCTCGNPDCAKIAKHPCIKDWPVAATTDEAQIREWFRQSPYANVGIATGAESDLIVLDLDRKGERDGFASLRELEQVYGSLPDTLFVQTGSDGGHRYFRSTGLANRSRGGIRPGIDIRAEGGMVVAPPSIHATGRRYTFQNDLPVVAAPDWLIKLIQKHVDKKASDKETLAVMRKTDAAIPKGQRNILLASIGGKLRWNGLEAREIEALLLLVNEEHCEEPLEDTEVQMIAKNVSRYPVGRNRKQTWWYRTDVDFYQGQRIRLLTDYQRGWYRSLRDASWRYGGSLPATPEELVILAEPTEREQFLEESAPVLELFRPLESSFGKVLVDEELVRQYLESTAIATVKSKGGVISGENRRGEAERRSAEDRRSDFDRRGADWEDNEQVIK
jgi:hypothetical protein